MNGSVARSAFSNVDRVVHDRRLRRHLAAHGPEFARGVLHKQPGVRIGKGARLSGPGDYELDSGVCIRDGARVFVGPRATLTMARGSAIGARTVVNVEESVSIGAGTQISWQCQILDTDFHLLFDDTGTPAPARAPIVIGERVLVGTGAIILKGVTIGNGAVIAAGSVVSRDVPPYRLVAGNPARDIRRVTRWQ